MVSPGGHASGDAFQSLKLPDFLQDQAAAGTTGSTFLKESLESIVAKKLGGI